MDLRVGACGVNILTNKPEVSFSCSAFSLIKERLGLPDQYLTNIPRDHIMGATPFYHRENGTTINGSKLPNILFSSLTSRQV
jgi:hypothetical protein